MLADHRPLAWLCPRTFCPRIATFAQLTFTIAGTSSAAQTTHKITVTVNIGTNVPGSVTPASQSITGVNSSAKFTVNVNPASFAGSSSLTFSCLNADTGAALPGWLGCSLQSSSIESLQQPLTTTLTLTEQSTPTSLVLISPPSPFSVPGFGSGFRIASAWTMALAALCLMLTMFTLGRRQRLSAAVVLRGFLVMSLTIVLATGLVSCGGSTSTPTTTTTGTGGTSGTGRGHGRYRRIRRFWRFRWRHGRRRRWHRWRYCDPSPDPCFGSGSGFSKYGDCNFGHGDDHCTIDKPQAGNRRVGCYCGADPERARVRPLFLPGPHSP